MASLASLLNPSPATEEEQQQSESVPSTHHPVDPHAHDVGQPPLSPVQPGVNVQEAGEALKTLAASSASALGQWDGQNSGRQLETDEPERLWERRASANQGDPMQLPPPTADPSRKMSSPTLDQYQVASRSPELRRTSVASSAEPSITLAPIQGIAAQSTDQERVTSSDSSRAAAPLQHSPPPATQEDPASAMSAVESPSHTPHSNPSQHEDMFPTTDQKPNSSTSPTIVPVKVETVNAPASDTRRPSDIDTQSSKTIVALKHESSQRNPSPLRESSVPVPTTEDVSKDEPAPSKKRPAPAKTKKGTASAIKKERAPPAKKRKVDSKRADTPSLRSSKATGARAASSKGTPLNSSPAPSIRSHSADDGQDDDEDEEEMDEEREGDDDLYCTCRKPDTGTFMIGCDGTCDDWFHGKCVGIEERDKNLIDKYMCPNCTKAGIGRTTWKRICRRPGCRQPARLGKAKSGNHASKYCSEDCGVLYFREMVAKSRGRDDNAKGRGARRRPSLDTPEKHLPGEDDLGARGGVLAAGEVKALLHASKTVDVFRRLGDGVLSPPRTPDGENGEKALLTDAETRTLEQIAGQKEEARRRHTLLKDRMKFVTMVKQAAGRVTAEKELKPKEYCGYDSRIEWTEQRFQAWRNSQAGQQAFEVGTSAHENGDKGDGAMDEDLEICDRKKCARHFEWAKLAVDDLRFEMSDNSDRMRALDQKEKRIRETAFFRSRSSLSKEGTVEIHAPLGGSEAEAGSRMDVDVPAAAHDVVATVEDGSEAVAT